MSLTLTRPTIFGAIVAVVLTASVAFAQPFKPGAAVPSPVAQPQLAKPPAAPSALGAAKRLEGVNRALKLAGVPVLTVAPPPSDMRVTPLASTTRGARITFMGEGHWMGATSDHPDGAMTLLPRPQRDDPTRVHDMKVGIDFAAEVGKLYLVDVAASGNQVDFTHGFSLYSTALAKDRTRVNVEGGHALFTFRADKAAESVSIITPGTYDGLTFYSVEVTKLN